MEHQYRELKMKEHAEHQHNKLLPKSIDNSLEDLRILKTIEDIEILTTTNMEHLIQLQYELILKQRCEGCQYNHPSQKYHNYCIFGQYEDHDEIYKIAHDQVMSQTKKGAKKIKL